MGIIVSTYTCEIGIAVRILSCKAFVEASCLDWPIATFLINDFAANAVHVSVAASGTESSRGSYNVPNQFFPVPG